LSTLAFGITGLAVIALGLRNKRSFVLNVNDKILSNDILFFEIVYVLAILFSLIPPFLKKPASPIFLIIYGVYIYRTFKQEGVENTEPLSRLYFSRKKNPSLSIVLLQDLAALVGIVVSARFFVQSIEHLSTFLHLDPLIFSLFIAPVATELPEKFNSIMWIRRRKDTLALGNISGAMVFQSSVVVFVGVMGTKWILSGQALLSAAITLVSSLLVIGYMKVFKRLDAFVLIAGLFFYILYIIFTVCYNLKAL
jgi:cation:H+ antiporter